MRAGFASSVRVGVGMPVVRVRVRVRVRVSRRGVSGVSCGWSGGVRGATDLVVFRRSRFAAHLSELRARGHACPARDGPTRLGAALAAAGAAHEERVLDRLQRVAGAPVVVPRGPDARERTREALAAGEPLVAQPALAHGFLAGYADVLLRNSHNPFVDSATARPDAYAVIEVKLAGTVKADYALQAAAYTHMLASDCKQLGLPPPGPPALWLGGAADAPVQLEAAAAECFFLNVRKAFEKFLEMFDPHAPWPEIDASLADLIPWSDAARAKLAADDSILQVAGARRSQVYALRRAGVHTMAELAKLDLGAVPDRRVEGVGRAPLEALQKQAAIQVQSRELSHTSPPAFELLFPPLSSRFGLHRLPAANKGDLYFDLEGFPLYDGGLEYLFGASDGKDFHAWWAHDRDAENSQFATFVHWLWERWTSDKQGGDMHVYHYGHYEMSALRRLASRAKTAEASRAGVYLEDMLDAGVFVDVYKVVKTSIRIGEPSYSIKAVEKLVGVSRVGDELADAQSSVAMYYEWRRKYLDDAELSSCQGPLERRDDSFSLLSDIETYNRQDCESLYSIVDWLRAQARENDIEYIPSDPSQPVGEDSSRGGSASHATASDSEDGVAGSLATDRAPLARGACGSSPERKRVDSAVIRDGQETAIELLQSSGDEELKTLAHTLGFHAREMAPGRAQFADRVSRASAGDVASLFSDDLCVSQIWLVRKFERNTDRKSNTSTKWVHGYRHDPSESHRLEVGDRCAFIRIPGSSPGGRDSRDDPVGHVAGFAQVCEVSPGFIGLDFGRNGVMESSLLRTGALVRSSDLLICPAAIRASLLDCAKARHENNSSLVMNYLRRWSIKDALGREVDLECSRKGLAEFLMQLNGQTLVIQGPPGTGKTVTSAKLISELVCRYRKTVAVSSNSHAAIDNLLIRAVESGVPARVVRKIGPKSVDLDRSGIRRCKNMKSQRVAPLNHGELSATKVASLVGATAYPLSTPEAVGNFDFIFVDEAGQVPMANFVAVAPCANSAVIVGDQQQLDMPLEGQHPDEVRTSCLSYFVGDGVIVVPPSRGLFLETSYRMAPELCNFVSRTMYGGALQSAPLTENHAIHVPSCPGRGDFSMLPSGSVSGLLFVDRDGLAPLDGDLVKNRGKRHCPTEVLLAKNLMEELLECEYYAKGAKGTLCIEDVLVVAPYNLQVAALKEALPDGSRVGTIDKFQGQEAPVVIVSTCAVPEGENGSFTANRDDFALDPLEREETVFDDRHGALFALQRRRLNVALSRAQCLAIIIGPSDVVSRADVRDLEDAAVLSFYSQVIEAGRRNLRPVADNEQSKLLQCNRAQTVQP